MNSAAVHARAYSRSDLCSLSVPAPIANVDCAVVRAKAGAVVDQVVALLCGEG